MPCVVAVEGTSVDHKLLRCLLKLRRAADGVRALAAMASSSLKIPTSTFQMFADVVRQHSY